MKQTFLLLILLLCLPLGAQQTFRARVVDAETGEALQYASIYISKDNGTLTNTEGEFTIDADSEDILRISYVGYRTLEVKAGELSEEVRMESLSSTIQELTVLPAESILEKMIKRIQKEYKSSKGKRGTYFYRLTNNYGGKQELLEAYMTAEGRKYLHNISFSAGRRLQKRRFAEVKSQLAYSNFQKMLESGPFGTVDHLSLRSRLVTPIHVVLSMNNNEMSESIVTPHMQSTMNRLKQDPAIFKLDRGEFYGRHTEPQLGLNKGFYHFSAQTMQDEQERKIYKIKAKSSYEFGPFIDGVFYVEDKSYELLCFEGKLHNYVLDVEKDFRRASQRIEPTFRVTYKHNQGFTEVESIVVKFEAGDLTSQSVVFNLGERKLPFKTSKLKTSENLMEAIDQTKTDSSLWNATIIQRTETEERLIRQQAIDREDIIEWDFAKLDNKYEGTGNMRPYLERLEAFGKTIPQEKVYVHMDNTCYFQGDTIWFAAYTRQTSDGKPSQVSGVLYVELLNNDGYLVERKLIKMQDGRGSGFFALNKQIQYSGFYELRAYTRWQLNWGRFEHRHSQTASRWFVTKDFEQEYYRDYEKLYSRVFPVYDRPQVAGDYTRDMTMRVMRRTFKDDPDAPKPTLTLFPEGGNLVAGVENRVAFEATMSDGEWLKGSLSPNPGPLLSSPKEEGIRTVNRGRGVFTIVPEKGMEQEVTFITEDGRTVKAKLPKPEEQGVALQVKQEGDSICIEMHLAGVNADSLAMTIMHEGRVEEFHLLTEGSRFKVQGSKLPCGVHQVTVFDATGRVWADRLFFVKKQEEMQPTLTVSGTKEEYQPYDSIGLDIQGKAGDATISLAVRDGYQADVLFDNANIMVEMLLSSEIRGFVPDPGWFFEKDDEEHRTALDLLMMTQGWRRFNWRDMAVKGEWDLTQPDERYAPIIMGRIRPNPYRDSIKSNNADVYIPWQLEKQAELSLYDEDDGLTEQTWEQTWETHLKESEKESQAEKKARLLALAKKEKERALRLHVEHVPTSTMQPCVSEMDVNDNRFRLQLPPFYGKSILFLSVADTTKWEKRKKQYTWIQMAGPAGELALHHQRKLDTEPAEYLAYVSWPYPRFVKRYDYHHTHLMEVERNVVSTPMLLPDSVHLMQEVAVKARRRNRLRRFNDAFPTLAMDAYEAWNMMDDAGIIFSGPKEIATLLASNWSSTTPPGSGTHETKIQYGISPSRRRLPQYIDIPTDSLYHPKYLTSIAEQFDFSPGEKREYWGDERIAEDPRFLIDRYILYTDYQPRLEGSKRYDLSTYDETRIAIYPFYDGGERVIYRDRRYILDGFAQPAEFYSPDYSKQKPQEPTDYRRTLYWNPNLQLDAEGRAHVTLFNNSKTTQIEVDAAGMTEEGGLLWK